MKRSEFVQLAISDPKKGAKILRANARQLEATRNVTKTAEVLSRTLFVTDRTIFSDCKK